VAHPGIHLHDDDVGIRYEKMSVVVVVEVHDDSSRETNLQQIRGCQPMGCGQYRIPSPLSLSKQQISHKVIRCGSTDSKKGSRSSQSQPFSAITIARVEETKMQVRVRNMSLKVNLHLRWIQFEVGRSTAGKRVRKLTCSTLMIG
jgi:hypothetical protein